MNYYQEITEAINKKTNECERIKADRNEKIASKKDELYRLMAELDEAGKKEDYERYTDLSVRVQMYKTMIHQLETQKDSAVDQNDIHKIIADVNNYTVETLTSKYKELQNMLEKVSSCIDEIEEIYKTHGDTYEHIEDFANKYTSISMNRSLYEIKRCMRITSILEGFKNNELKAIRKFADSNM